MAEFQCPLLGVKQTLITRAVMSAFDPKRTFVRFDASFYPLVRRGKLHVF